MNKFKKKVQELKREAQTKANLKDVSPEWIEQRLLEVGIDRIKFREALHLDESSFSLIMKGNRAMSKGVKGAMFYYLAYKEQLAINKQLLKALDIANKSIHQITLDEAIEKVKLTESLNNENE